MRTAERTPTQTTSPPTSLKPQPRVSRWAYVLIVIGVLALFDLISMDIWGTPLVMIAIGIALLTRPFPWGRTFALVLMSLVLIVIGGWYFIRPVLPAGPSTQTISQPLTAARAEIQLSTTVGRLDIGPTTSGKLIDAALDLGRNDRLDRAFSVRGDTQVVSLVARRTGPDVALPWNNSLVNSHWNIGLTPKVPLSLKVDTGVGVGQATVHLPATGVLKASVDGGVGQLMVTLPRGMESRITVSSGIGAVRVLGDFQRDGDVYTSSGYAGATNRTDLQIQGGIGQITVEQAGR